jgi:acetyl-CoA carboxylase carboxyltransferase component
MGAPGAVEVLFQKEIASAEDKNKVAGEKLEEYENKFLNPEREAQRGYVDAVINPSETRSKLYRHLKSHLGKTPERPSKHHGNIPT